MAEDRWSRIEETFHAALELPTHERAAYLDNVCGGDTELRREIETLLGETQGTKHFMESPAGGLSIAPLDLPSLEGRVLNHYQIGPLIGSGGMGEVYRARDVRLGRDVAIKVLHHVRYVDRNRLDPIYREARVLASLNHPNIAAIHGLEEAEGLCGLVLELVEGESLAERIQRGPLPFREALNIARQVATGLKAAHAKGIIHRDLKPANIKITGDGTVKLVDFGLAKLLHSLDIDETVPDISRQGVVMGTVAYMSPEQARGKAIDARTDVWAFGCVLYEMLAGKAAFRGDSPTDIIIKIAAEEPDWNEIPRLPAGKSEIERLIRTCFQKDPDSRYSSIEEVSSHLDAVQGQTDDSRSTRPPDPLPIDEDFVLPGNFATPLFMIVQVGYLALYGAVMYHSEAVANILKKDFLLPWTASFTGTVILAMCGIGIAVRLYLISAVGWHHPYAGRRFIQLFPIILILDGIWAAAPLLLWSPLRLGPAFACVALLAYVPFAQRTLIRTIYPRRRSE
jgi:serine/threonine protein kinase